MELSSNTGAYGIVRTSNWRAPTVHGIFFWIRLDSHWCGVGVLYDPCSKIASRKITLKINLPIRRHRSILTDFSKFLSQIDAFKALFLILDLSRVQIVPLKFLCIQVLVVKLFEQMGENRRNILVLSSRNLLEVKCLGFFKTNWATAFEE